MKTKAFAKAVTPVQGKSPDSAGVLLQKVGKALKRPGLSHHAVFGAKASAVAYSVYPADTSKLLRTAADGTKTVGRLVRGKFKEAA